MLYQFLLNFVDTFGFLNVFKYLTFRTGLSVFTSLIIVLIIGGPIIRFFSNQKILNPIRDDGPEDHIIKKAISDLQNLDEVQGQISHIRILDIYYEIFKHKR